MPIASKVVSPILLIIYNRAEQVKQAIEQLRLVKPAILFITGDGPKDEADALKVKQARAVIETIDWKCKIEYHFLDKNVGCRAGVSQGINWFFSKVDRGIILEDDCLPDKSFFTFCDQMLERYEQDTRIGMISGTNFFEEDFIHQESSADYFFSRYTSIWGWATWKDRWQSFQLAYEQGSQLINQTVVSAAVKESVSNQVYQAIQATTQGKIDTWDYTWLLATILENRLSIVPVKNLVSNRGFGKDATHTKFATSAANMSTSSLAVKKHPSFVFPNYAYDQKIKQSNQKIYLLLDVIKHAVGLDK